MDEAISPLNEADEDDGGTWQCANQPVICADAIDLS